MAAPAPTVADLQILIQALQAQNALLQAALSAAPAAGAAAVVTFAGTPQIPRGDQASMSKDARHLTTKLLLAVLG